MLRADGQSPFFDVTCSACGMHWPHIDPVASTAAKAWNKVQTHLKRCKALIRTRTPKAVNAEEASSSGVSDEAQRPQTGTLIQ